MQNKNKSLPIASEYAECCLLAEYLDVLKRTGKIRQFTHIPNETWTPSHAARNRNKAMGVSAGVPDYLIVLNDGSTFFIEMKREKGGVISDSQKAWIADLNTSTTQAVVCKGFDEAEDVLNTLLKTKRPIVKTDPYILNAHKARSGLLDH